MKKYTILFTATIGTSELLVTARTPVEALVNAISELKRHYRNGDSFEQAELFSYLNSTITITITPHES